MFRIYSAAAGNWTGHLHTVDSREGAEAWVAEFRRQGYRGVWVAGDDMSRGEVVVAREAAEAEVREARKAALRS